MRENIFTFERTGKACCHLIGAGLFGDAVPEADEGDLVIACDGGIRACRERGIRPDLLLGDFDSLGYVPEGEGVIVLPVRKDVTDIWAAYEEGKRRGYEHFRLYGAAGGERPSHTFANIQLLTHMAENGDYAEMYGTGAVYTVIRNSSVRIDMTGFGHVSVMALSERASGVRISGLSYELSNAELRYDFPLGVGNLPADRSGEITVPACVSVQEGTLLIIAERA